jgi:hypothetical protein
MGRMVTKGLAGDSSRRMQEGGAEHNNQPKRGMRGDDASKRGNATGNNQPEKQKDKRAAQHEQQCNNGNDPNATIATAPVQPQQQGLHHCNEGKDTTATNTPAL